MAKWLPWTNGERSAGCGCEPTRDGGTLRVAAQACPHDGDLAVSPECRETVIDAVGDSRLERVLVDIGGREAAYLDAGRDLLAAAGRFTRRVRVHDERLADLARRDPLEAAATAGGRADPIRSVATDAGLLAAAEGIDSYERGLRPAVAPAVSDARIVTAPPPDGRLVDQRHLSTDAVVRLFERPDDLPLYHVEPLEVRLTTGEGEGGNSTGSDVEGANRKGGDRMDGDGDPLATLDRAADLLASGAVSGDGAAREAVRRAADEPALVEPLGSVLEKHTADLGVLVDCFADPAVTDVFATPPIPETPLRVRVDGDLAATNVRLSDRGARALASTFRLRSGRAFSRASPLLDATATAGDREVRVAGTTEPVSDGLSFAVRAHDRDPWTLARLVGNGTIPPRAAGVLSLAVERGAAILVAGPRGAGKTTLLGALLFELPRDVRTLLIEDTPELPVRALQERGRDVHTLHTETGDGPGLPPATVLRGALRLGEGALVVGEVRGEEAAVLYEAMRVGASDGAVLGTIHGDDGPSVRERVVSDLDVPESSFATTDLVVSLESTRAEGERERRLAAVEEVIEGDDGVRFASLFDSSAGAAGPTGRVDRGASRFVEALADSGESYADVRAAIDRRADRYVRDVGEATEGRPGTVADPC